MLEAFAAQYSDVQNVHIVNTPLPLAQGLKRAPYLFVIKAFLERDTNWKPAMEPIAGTLVLYDRDAPQLMEMYLTSRERTIAARVRNDIINILAERNTQALIAEQCQPVGLDERWVRIALSENVSSMGDENTALIAKARDIARRNKPALPGTLFDGREWVLRDTSTALTLATPWEPDVQTLEKWQRANPGNAMGWHFLADAFRAGEHLHKRELLFMDWAQRNIAVDTNKRKGRLFDYEAVIPVGSAPFFIPRALAEDLGASPVVTAMTTRHDLFAAAACVEDMARDFSPPAAFEAGRIAFQLKEGNKNLAEAASLLDNLAI